MNPLNPEAGETPAPSDPLALAVATRVGALIWRAVPYFGLRYGERGRRFGLSDGAWLLTLSGLPEEARLAQVDWLAGVLAPRGIPSWLLELQLSATVRLGGRLGWSGAEGLRDATLHLGARRRTKLSDEAFSEAGRCFSRHAGPSRLAEGTGRLVASACVDAATGLCASPAPLLDWLRDPSVSPPGWRDAVDATGAFVGAVVDAR